MWFLYLTFTFDVYLSFIFVLISLRAMKNVLQNRCVLKYFQKLYEITKTLTRIHGRSLMKELGYNKVAGFQASVFLGTRISRKLLLWLLPRFTSTNYIVFLFIDLFFVWLILLEQNPWNLKYSSEAVLKWFKTGSITFKVLCAGT